MLHLGIYNVRFVAMMALMTTAITQRQLSWERGAKLLPTTLNSAQVMKLFGVAQSVVRMWHHSAWLPADQPPVAGKRQPFKYPRTRVIQFAKKHELELNLEAIGIVGDSP